VRLSKDIVSHYFDLQLTPESAFYDIQTNDTEFEQALKSIKAADFIAWDSSFFDFIGPDAKVERILSFPNVEHVHEAPIFVPETNELLFSDTSALGWLWAINVDTYKVSLPFSNTGCSSG
jgi:hypothetical protein